MKRNILWIFLVIAPLVSASSLGSFEATCSGTVCSGSDNGLSFSGPFPNFPYNPFIDFSIGTHGGSFTSGGDTCDYDVLRGGGNCYGEARFGADLGPPDATGLSLGDVVSVKGTGTAETFFCWGGDCGGSPPENVPAMYQFTLTNPGTSSPFTWTAAQFGSVPEPSVPEPGTLVFATLGLAGMAVGWRGRRYRSQGKPVANKDYIPDR
jgi:hypothetical protein